LRPASISADPRRQAALILTRVEQGGAHAARLLGQAPAVCRELVLGTLRWQLTLDHILAPFLRRPLAGLDATVRAVLRSGLYEAQRLSTPAPIAVAEAVRVAKVVAPAASGLVNAVLRRAVAAVWPASNDASVPASLRYSHPRWLVERWQRLLDDELAEAALAADQEPAPLSLLAALSDEQELKEAGCRWTRHPWVAGVWQIEEGAEAAVRLLAAGHGYALDPTAVAVARLLPQVDGLVVDLAAAPGGKTLVLASERRGKRALASDRHLARAVLMRSNLRRATASPPVVVADAAAAPLAPSSCAAVILDAPCSGTGTLRRHPEIRWRLRETDLVPLAAGQRRLTAAAASLLVPGGYLLYSTCSLEPEENMGVVDSLALEPMPLAGRLPAGVPFVELASGGVVLPPTRWGDGFTVHLLRRGA
jgi:16S rRNA (cytosine967-C5)-methyltransferase